MPRSVTLSISEEEPNHVPSEAEFDEGYISDDSITPPQQITVHPMRNATDDVPFQRSQKLKDTISTFISISTDFNTLDAAGKTRLLPYLLHWLTKKDIKYYISVKRKEEEYTYKQSSLIDKFNLLPERRRRELFPKIASYFILTNIDFHIIHDEDWPSPFIQQDMR